MDAEFICHPFIIGEPACGNFKNRYDILTLLRPLSFAPVLEFDEFLFFTDENKLMGIGTGFVDVHILASAKLAGTLLWTADKKLNSAAIKLSLNCK
jgi:hypothetical protein